MIAGNPYRTRIRVPDDEPESGVDHALVRRRWRRYRRVTIEFKVVLFAWLLGVPLLAIVGWSDDARAIFSLGMALNFVMWARIGFCRCPHCHMTILGGPSIEGRHVGPIRFPRACTHCKTPQGAARPRRRIG